MDITIKAENITVTRSAGSYPQTIDVEITGANEDFIEQVSKEASITDLLAGKTESEIRSWVVSEYDWVQNLLNEFWQRSSDACPLEASEAEEQENEFVKYVNAL